MKMHFFLLNSDFTQEHVGDLTPGPIVPNMLNPNMFILFPPSGIEFAWILKTLVTN